MSSTLNRLRRLHGLGKKSPKKNDQSSADLPSRDRSSASVTSSGIVDSDSSSTQDNQSIYKQQNSPIMSDPAFSLGKTLDEAVSGIELHNGGGTCYVVAYALPIQDERGGDSLSKLLNFSAESLHRFHPNFHLSSRTSFRTAAFLDTETTGLGAGAGVYCFMVGIGRFESYPQDAELSQPTLWSESNLAQQIPTEISTEAKSPTHFVVRQLFMRRPSEECALLIAFASLLEGCSMTVTFNGRVFDLPLLRTRFQQNQQLLPKNLSVIQYPVVEESSPKQGPSLLREDKAHFDLLIPARRLWRRRLESCRLVWLEKHLLSFTRTSDDVPGHMIPLLYAQFASRTDDDAGYMPGIFYHNREDIISMVGLTAKVYELFEVPAQLDPDHDGGPIHGLDIHGLDIHGLEWLSLGCCYETVDDIVQAEFAFTQALERLGNGTRAISGRIEVYRRLGHLYKRRGSWEEATTVWQQWLSTVDEPEPAPFIELAKYCEWQANDLEQAEMWTRWALHNLESNPRRSGKTIATIDALHHRLSRIRRKRDNPKK